MEQVVDLAGAYILNSGLSKRGLKGEAAQGIHGLPASGHPEVDTLDPEINEGEIATECAENAGIDTVMTNSFGFGGTNGSMLMSKYHG